MTKKRFIIFDLIIFSLSFCAVVLLCTLLTSQLYSKNTAADPTVSPPSVTVIIDAGHGGEDGGAIGKSGVLEKDLNLAIAQKLYDELVASGVNCVMTRQTDTLLYDRNQDYEGRKKALDAKARIEISQKYENAIFVSIHQNSYPVEKYSGFQVYYSPNNESSLRLAQSFENGVREKLQPNNNRASKASGGKIYILDNLTCPAVLLECGFISNHEECEKLSSEKYQRKLAQTLSDTLINFINNSATS